MPLTKKDIENIKEALCLDTLQKSIDNIQTTIEENDAKLVVKFNELETKITAKLDEKYQQLDLKIVALETAVNNDVAIVKANLSTLDKANTNLTMLVDQHKEAVDKKLETIEEFTAGIDEKVGTNETNIDDHDDDIDRLKLKLEKLEKAVYAGLQHSRKWNIQVDGIPMNIGDEPAQLEIAFLEILKGINVNLGPFDIEAIHRLPSRGATKSTIVRIFNRKSVDLINANKSKLKNLSSLQINIAGLTPDSKIYIKPSLTPYNNSLAYNCRLLKRDNRISKIITEEDGTLKIVTLNNEFIKIRHETDLTRKFKDFTFFFDED